MTRDERAAAVRAGAGAGAVALARHFGVTHWAIEAIAERNGIVLGRGSAGDDVGQPAASEGHRPPAAEGDGNPDVNATRDGGSDEIAPTTAPARKGPHLDRAASTHRPQAGSPWQDEERVALLRELWPQPGMTAGAIAARLGGGLTAPAVISKAHSLHLGPKPQLRASPREAKPRPPAYGKPHGSAAPSTEPPRPEPRKAPPPLPKGDIPAPAPLRLSLTALTLETCRWPLVARLAPATVFCGVPRYPGRVYCAYHARLAYVPAAQRRRYDKRNDLATE